MFMVRNKGQVQTTAPVVVPLGFKGSSFTQTSNFKSLQPGKLYYVGLYSSSLQAFQASPAL